MGSHYIPVGKLKVDLELFELVCPTIYPPEVVCPANGYIPEPGQPYVPPIEIGTPGVGEIYLLCQNSGFAIIQMRATLTVGYTGRWFFEVYDANNNYLYTSAEINQSTTGAYSFPGEPNALFIVKIKPRIGDKIASWKVYQDMRYSGADYSILQAKFNTPDLIDLSSAFTSVKAIRDVQFIDVSSLQNMTSTFSYCGLEYFKPSTAFSELTNMSTCFDYAKIVQVDLSDSSFPKLTNITNLCRNTYALFSFKFPSSLPELTLCVSSFEYSFISYLTMFLSAPKVTSYANFIAFTRNLKSEIVVPESIYCTTLFSFASESSLPYLKFTGDWTALNTINTIVSKAAEMCYLEFPRIIGSPLQNCTVSGVFNANTDMEAIVLPDIIYAVSPITFPSQKLKHVSGNMLFIGSTNNAISLTYGANLETYNCPNAVSMGILIGWSAPATKLTSVVINWADSLWDSGVVTPRIGLNANLDALELNRIMTELPVVTTSPTLNIKYCTGYSTCDKTIATAKGWLVP